MPPSITRCLFRASRLIVRAKTLEHVGGRNTLGGIAGGAEQQQCYSGRALRKIVSKRRIPQDIAQDNTQPRPLSASRKCPRVPVISLPRAIARPPRVYVLPGALQIPAMRRSVALSRGNPFNFRWALRRRARIKRADGRAGGRAYSRGKYSVR